MHICKSCNENHGTAWDKRREEDTRERLITIKVKLLQTLYTLNEDKQCEKRKGIIPLSTLLSATYWAFISASPMLGRAELVARSRNAHEMSERLLMARDMISGITGI